MSHAPIRTLTNVLLAGSLGLGMSSVALAQEAEAAEAPAAAPAEPSWTDSIKVGAFVDAYAAYRSDNNTAATPTSEAYVENNGFGLAFAGADLSYSGDQFGATMSLRYGPGVVRFYAADQGPLGIDNITQAFVTWKPVDKLTLDLGQFNTLYGAEVTESWRNVNYSRGALYYAFQPFWHTGLRANYAINDMIGVNAMIVNGVNNAFEGNKSPSVGLQVTAAPIDSLFLAVGYLGALHPHDDEEGAIAGPDDDADGAPDYFLENKFDNFVDVVATFTAGDFKLVGNFDYNMYRLTGAKDGENNWGVSVAPAYAITNWFGAGARVEYLSDSANNWFGMTDKGVAAKDSNLMTLTATLDFKPVPNSAALVLRPEFRYEKASDDYFTDRDNKLTDGFWVASLGAVVTSM